VTWLHIDKRENWWSNRSVANRRKDIIVMYSTVVLAQIICVSHLEVNGKIQANKSIVYIEIKQIRDN
jgi:hypothetical protein